MGNVFGVYERSKQRAHTHKHTHIAHIMLRKITVCIRCVHVFECIYLYVCVLLGDWRSLLLGALVM